MSVSHNLLTAVEEIKKWRCTKMNNGEHDERDSDSVSSVIVSPRPQQITTTTNTAEGWCLARRLSENEDQKTPQKNFLTKLSCQQQQQQQQLHPRIFRTFCVRLAEESPKRNNSDELSDSSTYDSVNCRETDICRDSSDTESNSSYSTDGIGATIKVVEYEVASASNNEDLFTNDSSSGTDDYILAAVARAICNSSKCSSDFADTEEESIANDSTYDSEFSSADYWVCIKCKNKQNNPMFRYCEKCYQIRKTHFPPRPRLRKSRTTFKRQDSSQIFSSLKRSITTSEVTKSLSKKRKEDNNNLTATPSSSSIPSVSSINTTGRLAIEGSHSQDSVDSISGDEDNNASHFSLKLSNNSFIKNTSEETPYSKYLSDSQKIPKNFRTATKRKLAKGSSKNKALVKRKCYRKIEMSSSSSGSEIETDIVSSKSLCGASSQGTVKDSGFSSAPSSQERKSSSEQPNEEDEDCQCGNNGENSDTVCEELDESDVAEMSQEKNCIPSTLEFDLNSQENSLGRHSSEISLKTTTTISTLVQSVSECSDAYTNIKASSSNIDIPEISSIKEKIRPQNPILREAIQNNGIEFPSYGSCMTCLTEPKNGVFVHSRFLHLCCCYKCAVKIWNKNKKCPICNCAVKNVMKLFVH